jgi:hypothetical protein
MCGDRARHESTALSPLGHSPSVTPLRSSRFRHDHATDTREIAR